MKYSKQDFELGDRVQLTQKAVLKKILENIIQRPSRYNDTCSMLERMMDRPWYLKWSKQPDNRYLLCRTLSSLLFRGQGVDEDLQKLYQKSFLKTYDDKSFILSREMERIFYQSNDSINYSLIYYYTDISAICKLIELLPTFFDSVFFKALCQYEPIVIKELLCKKSGFNPCRLQKNLECARNLRTNVLLGRSMDFVKEVCKEKILDAPHMQSCNGGGAKSKAAIQNASCSSDATVLGAGSDIGVFFSSYIVKPMEWLLDELKYDLERDREFRESISVLMQRLFNYFDEYKINLVSQYSNGSSQWQLSTSLSSLVCAAAKNRITRFIPQNRSTVLEPEIFKGFCKFIIDNVGTVYKENDAEALGFLKVTNEYLTTLLQRASLVSRFGARGCVEMAHNIIYAKNMALSQKSNRYEGAGAKVMMEEVDQLKQLEQKSFNDLVSALLGIEDFAFDVAPITTRKYIRSNRSELKKAYGNTPFGIFKLFRSRKTMYKEDSSFKLALHALSTGVIAVKYHLVKQGMGAKHICINVFSFLLPSIDIDNYSRIAVKRVIDLSYVAAQTLSGSSCGIDRLELLWDLMYSRRVVEVSLSDDIHKASKAEAAFKVNIKAMLPVEERVRQSMAATRIQAVAKEHFGWRNAE